MSIFPAEQLASMRATVDSTLTDACTIAGQSEPAFDPDTGTYTDTPGDSVYSGPCRLGPTEGSDRVVEVGGEPVSLRTYKLRLPWGTEDIAVDQIVTFTTSNDPHLVGRRFRVIDVRGLTDVLSRSTTVEEFLG